MMKNNGEMDAGGRRPASSGGKRAEELYTRLIGPNRYHLASVIIDDIVPRLRLFHHNLSATDAERAFSRREIVDFSAILIDDDGGAVEQYLQKMRDDGHSEEALFLGLMSEAARHLGAQWEDDSRTFIDVTIGVARLQRVLCDFNAAFATAITDGHQRVLLCTLAGERHDFGLDMVACFMRHAAWDVDLQKECKAQDVANAVARERFAIVGLTLSAGSGLEALCRAIQAARAASLNPAIGVLVGGSLFRANPGLVAQVGADAMATDAASARMLAKRLYLRQQSSDATPDYDGWRYAPARPAPVACARRSTAAQGLERPLRLGVDGNISADNASAAG
jgi:methanogenic corrinoid protein MtbC1